MADRNARTPGCAPGAWYVDTSCIACGVCKEVAAGIFDVDDSQGYAVVTRQPATPQEQSLAAEARSQCPVDAIGQDGQ